MASNVQVPKNFPKGSYRAYTSLLKQYAPNKPTTSKLAPTPAATEQVHSSTSPPPITKSPELRVEALLALTNGEIDMLDANVLRQFLELITAENQSKSSTTAVVDVNNNNPQKEVLDGEDIETSKHNLIQSLKAQLERYRQH